MANAESITITEFVENIDQEQPTADVLDTGTAAVTLPLTPDCDTHRILLEFTNTAEDASTMNVSILAGDNPPASQAERGNLAIALAQSVVKYVVLESARFMQSDGTIQVTSTPVSGKTQTLTIRAYRMPK